MEQDSTPVPQHLLNVYRNCTGLSNSGFFVGASSSNAIVEGSVFRNSDNCVTVEGATDLIFERGSTCSGA